MLLALGGLHVLAFMAWQTPRRPLAAHVPPRAAITYLLAPARQPLAIQSAPLLSKPLERSRTASAARIAPKDPAKPDTAAQTALTRPEAMPSQPQAITQPQPVTQAAPYVDPLALPPSRQTQGKGGASAEEISQLALKSAAGIDRQLRKESWNPRDKKIANEQTLLAGKLGGAYIGRNEPATYENITLPDGRLMTKVTSGGHSFCAYKESNALTGGRDPFRDGIKTKISSCP